MQHKNLQMSADDDILKDKKHLNTLGLKLFTQRASPLITTELKLLVTKNFKIQLVVTESEGCVANPLLTILNQC